MPGGLMRRLRFIQSNRLQRHFSHSGGQWQKSSLDHVGLSLLAQYESQRIQNSDGDNVELGL